MAAADRSNVVSTEDEDEDEDNKGQFELEDSSNDECDSNSSTDQSCQTSCKGSQGEHGDGARTAPAARRRSKGRKIKYGDMYDKLDLSVSASRRVMMLVIY